MAVSDDDVRAAYRWILGREAESERVVREHMALGSIQELRNSMLDSHEFRSQYKYFPVGLHLDVEHLDIEVETDQDKLSKLVQETATAWRLLGETEPHWSVITCDDFKSSNIEVSRRNFYESGKTHVARLRATLRRNGLDFPKTGICMDFGCGAGRLSIPLAEFCQNVVAVDISEPHLRLAREAADDFGVSNISFNVVDSIDAIGDLPPYDSLVSLIVLQHNVPPVIYTILDRLLALMKPSGWAIFQVPTFIANYRFSADQYLKDTRTRSMEMHPLPQPYVYELIYRHGCQPVEIREDTLTGNSAFVSQTFLIRKSK